MRNLISVVFFFCILFGFAQTQIRVSNSDTVIDFRGHKIFENLHGYENRVIREGDKVLYAKISFEEKKEPNVEYFRVNDTLFKSIEYYESGNIKSTGCYSVSGSLSPLIDTLTSENPNDPGIFIFTTLYYREIEKTGMWRESSDYESISDYGDYWEGEYKSGRRSGMWKHMISSFNDLEIEHFVYGATMSPPVYVKNLSVLLPLDSIIQVLRGRWLLSVCEAKDQPRTLYYKCKVFEDGYGGGCYGDANYYDFISETKFNRYRGSTGCYKFKEASKTGKWRLLRENGQTFLVLDFSDSKETWTFKIIYLDREDLVTERQK